jgi:hypothetical protein
MMTVRLPDELRTVVTAHPGITLELLDELTHRAYVLIPVEEFERLKTVAEVDLAETYPAQIESAMRAGWNDPLMDEYNDYDSQRGQV